MDNVFTTIFFNDLVKTLISHFRYFNRNEKKNKKNEFLNVEQCFDENLIELLNKNSKVFRSTMEIFFFYSSSYL
jgi:hypothetical protein